MAGIRVQWSGIGDVNRLLREAADAGNSREFLQAFQAVGTDTLNHAKDLTPVDFGALKRSGQFAITRRARPLEGRITFGGTSASYAVFVHENMTARHTTGQAKYLETAVAQMASRYGQAMSEAYARALRRAGK